jgi:hypothetical protein
MTKTYGFPPVGKTSVSRWLSGEPSKKQTFSYIRLAVERIRSPAIRRAFTARPGVVFATVGFPPSWACGRGRGIVHNFITVIPSKPSPFGRFRTAPGVSQVKRDFWLTVMARRTYAAYGLEITLWTCPGSPRQSESGLFFTCALPSSSVNFGVVLVFRADGQPHPGMNAALVALHDFMIQLNGCTCASGEEDVVIARGLGNERAIYHLRALRGRGRIA